MQIVKRFIAVAGVGRCLSTASNCSVQRRSSFSSLRSRGPVGSIITWGGCTRASTTFNLGGIYAAHVPCLQARGVLILCGTGAGRDVEPCRTGVGRAPCRLTVLRPQLARRRRLPHDCLLTVADECAASLQ